MTDFTLAHHGSVALLTPNNAEAHKWLGEHIPDDALWGSKGVVIEPRYVEGMMDGIREDGMTLEVL